MPRTVLCILTLAAACSGPAPQSPFRLTLASSDAAGNDAAPQIAMRAGETRIVQLIVVGAAPAPVTFAGENLPPFATLAGPILTIAPQRPDQGRYEITLTAWSGSTSESARLQI